MADITLHFTNTRGEEATAVVRPPVHIRFRHGARALEAVVPSTGADVKAIFLNGATVPEMRNEPAPGVEIKDPATGEVLSSDEFVAGVCYEAKNGQIFCW